MARRLVEKGVRVVQVWHGARRDFRLTDVHGQVVKPMLA
ncbi:MAG: hypothetical protein NTW74_13640 [Acidobacteria bacterium]|nr:hypothetical protein [Acidobacteriota bacterium]